MIVATIAGAVTVGIVSMLLLSSWGLGWAFVIAALMASLFALTSFVVVTLMSHRATKLLQTPLDSKSNKH